ncbi:MAG: sulfite oxidase [Proteobacteria bacterium]|jgi:Sulfite oxidase and related enzymes|nr:MAG: sulfite oxidase [Pseudomonadota bacterium]
MKQFQLPRRHFLIAAGSAGMATALSDQLRISSASAQEAKPLPQYAAWKNPDAMIVHSSETLETKREFFGTSGITPEDMLYVRNNVPAPDESIVANRDAWEIEIEGVRNPGKKTLADLKKLGLESVAMVLQCSGNGRGFHKHKASGTPWTVGAAGNVIWSGVPVREVVKAMGGLADGRNFITGTGGEQLPANIDPKTIMVERSVPIAALEDALLAWEINGKPISLAHGGPLRLVLPGYYGVNNVKYIKKLAFTEKESDATIQRTGYRVRPPGQKGAPDQPSMWEMSVKSWITHPLKETDQGPVLIYGVAFGGNKSVKSVAVTTDGGQTWQEARFVGPDLGKYAWRTFVLAADLKPGTHIIASRATDVAGNTQPEEFEENERGYGHNGWRAHAVAVTVV